MFQMIILLCGFQKKMILKIGMFRFSCCLLSSIFFVKIILKFSGVVDVFFLTMQVFRSIDSGSLKGFPSDSKEASKQVSQHLYFLSSTAMMENILIASLGIFSKVLALLMLVLFLLFSLVLYCFKTVTGTN